MSLATSMSVEPVIIAFSINAADAVITPPALTLKLLEDMNDAGSFSF